MKIAFAAWQFDVGHPYFLFMCTKNYRYHLQRYRNDLPSPGHFFLLLLYSEQMIIHLDICLDMVSMCVCVYVV